MKVIASIKQNGEHLQNSLNSHTFLFHYGQEKLHIYITPHNNVSAILLTQIVHEISLDHPSNSWLKVSHFSCFQQKMTAEQVRKKMLSLVNLFEM
jgi:hypothetical protein